MAPHARGRDVEALGELGGGDRAVGRDEPEHPLAGSRLGVGRVPDGLVESGVGGGAVGDGQRRAHAHLRGDDPLGSGC